MDVFVALDFETANDSADSACALGLVRFERGVAVHRHKALIRPPTRRFDYTWVHGMTWADVATAEPFVDVWAEVQPLLVGARGIAAHNASFERRVLAGCLPLGHRHSVRLPWVCTLALARSTWRLERYDLATVCRHLGIALQHHEPLSDAEACGQLVLRAEAERRPGAGKRA